MGRIEVEEIFKQLDFIKINNKPLTYLQDDGGYMTQILFNNITQCVQISEWEEYNENKPQGSTTLSLELLDIINEQTQELKWRKE